jgi:hypothetical protein
MGQERDMSAIEEKLARCRELQREAECDFTRSHLRQLATELQAQLHRLDDSTAASAIGDRMREASRSSKNS